MTEPTSLNRLKRRARKLSRQAAIPLHEALDRIAQIEGYARWSLLAARAPREGRAQALLARLNPGDMALIGARPHQGKTRLGLDLLEAACGQGRGGAFFTLEYDPADIARIAPRLAARALVDCSDHISADPIIARMADAPPGRVIVVDYLQLLDQKRDNPPLQAQIRALRDFTARTGVICVFLAQIDRAYARASSPTPSWADLRLPNTLDIGLFDQGCFLQGASMRIEARG